MLRPSNPLTSILGLSRAAQRKPDAQGYVTGLRFCLFSPISPHQPNRSYSGVGTHSSRNQEPRCLEKEKRAAPPAQACQNPRRHDSSTASAVSGPLPSPKLTRSRFRFSRTSTLVWQPGVPGRCAISSVHRLVFFLAAARSASRIALPPAPLVTRGTERSMSGPLTTTAYLLLTVFSRSLY